MREEVKELKLGLAKQTDDGMRNSMTIHKIPKTKERESWTETRRVLAKFLKENVSDIDSEIDWYARIERAHRGRTEVIHVRFKHHEYAEEVRDSFFGSKGRKGAVFINDKYSDHTQERRNKAYAARQAYKVEHPNSKLYISYPANLKCKDPRDKDYRVVKQF